MKKKLVVIFVVLCLGLLVLPENVQAGIIDDIIQKGNAFSSGQSNSVISTKLVNYIKSNFIPAIALVGNLIFAITTMVLGVKYIWSGVEGKSKIKETLPTFVAAVVFFYLAQQLVTFFTLSGSILTGSGSYNSLSGKIMGTVNAIIPYLAFAGILFIGIKYMTESADGKAKIKERLTPMVLGIIFVFSASTIVNFIIRAANDII